MSGKRASHRVAWGFADQAFSSLTNFALNAIVAHSVAPRQFGAFAVVYATYLLALGVSRSLTTLGLLIRFTAVRPEQWRRGAAAATGAALAVGIVGSLVCVVAALLVASARAPLLALGVTLPGLLLQDAWRHAFFARGAGGRALANDAVWAVVMLAGLWLAISAGRTSASWFVFVWATSGSIAGLVGMAQAGLVPSPVRTVAWLRRHWDLSSRHLGEFAALSASNQAVTYVVATVGGLVAAGALRAGQVLLGPLTVLYQGIWIVSIPEQVRVLKDRPNVFRRASVLVSVLLGTIGVAYIVLLLLIGQRIGPFVLGETWQHAQVVLLPIGLSTLAWGLWMGATVGLRALEEAGTALRARVVVAILTVTGGSLGVALADARGAAWGLAAASIVGVGVWWRQFQSATSRNPLLSTRPIQRPLPGRDALLGEGVE